MTSRSSDEMLTTIPAGKLFYDFTDLDYPTTVTWKDEHDLSMGADNTTSYIYVASGRIEISTSSHRIPLFEGCYASVTGPAELHGAGKCLIATRIGYRGLSQFGGPVERLGRLRYIDGCSSSLLLCAPRLGDPCFNYLHVPPNTDQTPHTHPTLRVGYILDGSGYVKLADKTIDLLAGMMFCMLPNALHSFHTEQSELRVVIYHPDSDFGPSDDEHPILNRTIIEGVSAKMLRG